MKALVELPRIVTLAEDGQAKMEPNFPFLYEWSRYFSTVHMFSLEGAYPVWILWMVLLSTSRDDFGFS